MAEVVHPPAGQAGLFQHVAPGVFEIDHVPGHGRAWKDISG
jgi:hypothetical protein